MVSRFGSSSRITRVMLMVGVLAVGLGAGAVAMAHGGDTTVIHACVNNNSGVLRLVGENSACKQGETALDWNIQGPVGPVGPKGDTGDVGPIGPQGSAGVSGYQVVRNSTATNATRYKQLSVSCPPGKTILSGGAGVFWTRPIGSDWDIAPKLVSNFNYPSGSNAWYGEAVQPATSTADWYLEVHAVCANVN